MHFRLDGACPNTPKPPSPASTPFLSRRVTFLGVRLAQTSPLGAYGWYEGFGKVEKLILGVHRWRLFEGFWKVSMVGDVTEDGDWDDQGW